MSTIKKSTSLATFRDGGETSILPIRTTDGTVLDDIPEQLTLSGHDAFHPDVAVQTTRQELERMLDTITKDEACVMFPRIWAAIKNIDAGALYRRGGKRWNNFCNDIVIYYVCRNILFGKLIPAL